jgi:hypothetical protein
MKSQWKPVSAPATIYATTGASAKTRTATTTRSASPSPVIERIDHQMLNDLEPFTVLNPSAENIAKYLYDQTSEQLAGMTAGRVRIKDCTIWETDTTTATYYE